jgi:hypothetical protein
MVSKLIRFSTILSEANSIIKSTWSYPKRWRTQKLYKQWVERAGLQSEAIPAQKDKSENSPLEVINPDNVSARVRETPAGATEPDRHAADRKVAVFMMAEINKEQLRLAILLVLLGASLVIFCLGSILLLVYSF